MLTKELIAKLKSLKTAKGRKEHGMYLLEGYKGVYEAIGAGRIPRFLLFTQRKLEYESIIGFCAKNGVTAELISRKVMDAVCDVKTPQDILAIMNIPSEQEPLTGSLILAPTDVQDPGNIGTMIRSADAFGAGGVALLGSSASLYSPKVVRSSMGSIFHLPVMETPDACMWVSKMRTSGYRILASDTSGGELKNYNSKQLTVILIGNESAGLSDGLLDLSDEVVSIRMAGRAESLNAAVAAGIILYEFQKNL